MGFLLFFREKGSTVLRRCGKAGEVEAFTVRPEQSFGKIEFMCRSSCAFHSHTGSSKPLRETEPSTKRDRADGGFPGAKSRNVCEPAFRIFLNLSCWSFSSRSNLFRCQMLPGRFCHFALGQSDASRFQRNIFQRREFHLK